MRTAAIVAAGGRGERLGPAGPKALVAIGGVPMLVHAVRTLSAARGVDVVVVAAPADRVEETRALLAGGAYGGVVCEVVAGGLTRPESVRAALAALPGDVEFVLVHDAARALAPVTLVESVVDALVGGADAVVPGLPVLDTVKEVVGGVVSATLDRSRLVAVQTPQGFRREVLERAHRQHAANGREPTVPAVTDDAGFVELVGVDVVVVPGNPEAFKITGPLDLLLAETLLARREVSGAC